MEAPDFRKLADDAIDYTRAVINSYGPRLAGTEPCLKAADHIYQTYKEVCDKGEKDEYKETPDAFLRFGAVMSFFYYVSYFCLIFLGPGFSLLFAVIALSVLLFEYIVYFKYYDFYYPSKDCSNSYGVIEPKGEVKKTVIFSGHHDSAHIFNFYSEPDMYLKREIRFIIAHLYLIIYDSVLLCNSEKEWYTKAYYVHILLTLANIILFVLPIRKFASPNATPGAGDNLAAISMGVQLAKYFKENRLNSTRLIFASYDAEESGLRGSRKFFEMHKKEFDIPNTYNYNIDCSYFVEDLKFLNSDINGTVKLSKDVSTKCVEIAHKYGYKKAHQCGIPFLAGGTDAAEAARAGIKATTAIGIPFDPLSKSIPYHTIRDTPEAIEPECLEAMMKVFYELVHEIDDGKL
ncbi:putative aminopeptidase [Tritrichomonas foetus]|uniref:Aminopeptidase n=1 Tax=Tritrichomonas foetus TaxID=1144522 RepID=A0A1J4KD91_9EUKA|nr:putative aminopeptidase [Tritrichomonas foetus]|eukprot:OHT09163.1 putative aminopeptidase [Tritrichomonas foetus]